MQTVRGSFLFPGWVFVTVARNRDDIRRATQQYHLRKTEPRFTRVTWSAAQPRRLGGTLLRRCRARSRPKRESREKVRRPGRREPRCPVTAANRRRPRRSQARAPP